ncbi:MAG: hypothetical protein K0S07_1743 [Chlamydiales bacterium]|jgi:hypothetical protein|nr:hypothetical protein [Chlamydiales bacterium]
MRVNQAFRLFQRALFGTTNFEGEKRKETDSQKVSNYIKSALQHTLNGNAKSIKGRDFYIVGNFMPSGLELKESASKPLAFGNAVASLEQIHLSLSKETPDEFLERYQEMAAIITERFIEKRKRESLISSLIRKIASLFFAFSKREQVESLNEKIQYYRKDQESIFPFLPEEMSLKVFQELPLTALGQIATINSQGHRLACEALFNRAKAVGYQGSRNFIEIKKYFQEMHVTMKALCKKLPKRFQNASKTDLDSIEKHLLALQGLSNLEIARLFGQAYPQSKDHPSHWVTLAKYLLLFSKEHAQIDPEVDQALRSLPIDYCQKDVVFLLLKRGAGQEGLQEIFAHCFRNRYSVSSLLRRRQVDLLDRAFFEKMVSACDRFEFTTEKILNFLPYSFETDNRLNLLKLLLEKKGAFFSQEARNRALQRIFQEKSDEMWAEYRKVGYQLNKLKVEHQITYLRFVILSGLVGSLKFALSKRSKLDPNFLERDESSPFHAEFTTAWFLSQAPKRKEKIRILRESGWTGSET